MHFSLFLFGGRAAKIGFYAAKPHVQKQLLRLVATKSIQRKNVHKIHFDTTPLFIFVKITIL